MTKPRLSYHEFRRSFAFLILLCVGTALVSGCLQCGGVVPLCPSSDPRCNVIAPACSPGDPQCGAVESCGPDDPRCVRHPVESNEECHGDLSIRTSSVEGLDLLSGKVLMVGPLDGCRMLEDAAPRYLMYFGRDSFDGEYMSMHFQRAFEDCSREDGVVREPIRRVPLDEDGVERRLIRRIPQAQLCSTERRTAVFAVDLEALPRRRGDSRLTYRAFRILQEMLGISHFHHGRIKASCTNPKFNNCGDVPQVGVLCDLDVDRYHVKHLRNKTAGLMFLAGHDSGNTLCCPCENNDSIVVRATFENFSDVFGRPVVAFAKTLDGGTRCGDGRTRVMPGDLTLLLGRADQKEKVRSNIEALNDVFWDYLADGKVTTRARLQCVPCEGR